MSTPLLAGQTIPPPLPFDAFAAVARADRTDLVQWRDLSLSTGIEG